MKILYVETSAFLTFLLQQGNGRKIEAELKSADRLVSSRLLKLETERAIHRIALVQKPPSEKVLSELEFNFKVFLPRFDFVEITRDICEKAGSIAPSKNIRSLDAIHLASYFWLKSKLSEIEMLSLDLRVLSALG